MEITRGLRNVSGGVEGVRTAVLAMLGSYTGPPATTVVTVQGPRNYSTSKLNIITDVLGRSCKFDNRFPPQAQLPPPQASAEEENYDDGVSLRRVRDSTATAISTR